MENPFFNDTSGQPLPLCPWENDRHGGLYVPVDNTQNAFDEFREALDKRDVRATGSVHLIYGEDGCGKTSLIHRCAAYALGKFGGAKSCAIVDRSSESASEGDSLRKAGLLADAVRRAVESAQLLSKTQIERLPAYVSSLDLMGVTDNFLQLSEMLVQGGNAAIVIPAKLELPTELDTYLTVFARKPVTLLLETSQPQVAEHGRKLVSRKRVSVLEVGTLKGDDAVAYVQARMAEVVGTVFDEEGIKTYVKRRAKVSVLELQRVCAEIYSDAAKKGTTKITYAEFADIWVKLGTGLK